MWTDVGLLEHESSWDLLEIAVLACVCAVHKHGIDVLLSFSAMVQHTPNPPIGFSILKAGLNKSVLLSIYSSSTTRDCNDDHFPGTYAYAALMSFAILSNSVSGNRNTIRTQKNDFLIL